MLPIISGEFYNDNHISFTMPILSYEFKHLGLRSYFSILVGKLNFLLGPLGINKKIIHQIILDPALENMVASRSFTVEEADVWDSPEAAMEEDTNINMEDINCQYA